MYELGGRTNQPADDFYMTNKLVIAQVRLGVRRMYSERHELAGISAWPWELILPWLLITQY